MGGLLESCLNKLEHKIKSRMEQYNEWRLKYDDVFARSYHETIWTHSQLRTPALQCCHRCHPVLLREHHGKAITVTLNDLISSAEHCRICNILIRACLEHNCVNDDGSVYLLRHRAGVRAGSGGPRILRFTTDPGFLGKPRRGIPLGQPLLPDPDRYAQFQLLRAWLRKCDQTHRCNERVKPMVFPTRVLDIGGLQDMGHAHGWIRLLSRTEPRKTDRYVALSHCWGKVTNIEQTFCTTMSNIESRKIGFHVTELPKTFQDAIKVVQALGHRYLWIDSLCIIQSGDNGDDWEEESKQMKNVFSQAYCVIAATAAEHPYDGFLDKHGGRRTEHACVQDGPETQYYVSTDVDDFDADVGQAKLNARAWVMQELVLARRTIHFSANQVYWECGKGIHCENLTRLKSIPRNRYFMLDSEFPKRLVEAFDRDAMMNCIFFLIAEYSKREITRITDRPRAIRGLEDRIAEALGCESRFCTFDKLLHRNLLWLPLGEKKPRVQYADRVPSWSWLSSAGAVIFDEEDAAGTFHLNHALAFHPEREEVLVADLGVFVGCTLETRDAVGFDEQFTIWDTNKSKKAIMSPEFYFVDDDGSYSGWFEPDLLKPDDLDDLHCVVVARGVAPYDSQTYCIVLAVVSAARVGEYRRIGIALVRLECVVQVQDRVHIV